MSEGEDESEVEGGGECTAGEEGMVYGEVNGNVRVEGKVRLGRRVYARLRRPGNRILAAGSIKSSFSHQPQSRQDSNQ